MQLRPGQQIYKYRLKRLIGEGSFGQVWLTDDEIVNGEYAVKILKPDFDISAFFREARIGHQFDHDNVVQVHHADYWEKDQIKYPIIAMDYMPKGSVTNLANPASFIKLPKVIQLGRDILNGLGYLHSLNLLHCDIKPGNVLIGSREQGMISDYGIVEPIQNSILLDRDFMYFFHISPEELNRVPITVKTDIFQVGLTLFRMLVGLESLKQKYCKLGREAYLQAIINGSLISRVDFPPYVPNRFCRIILKAVNPDLTKRYSSALEMRRELEKLNYSGYWTVNEKGIFVGYKGNFIYNFEKERISRTRCNIVALKYNTATKQSMRCRKFCHKNLTNSEADREISKFMKSIVMKT